MQKICITYSFIVDNPNTLGKFLLFVGQDQKGENYLGKNVDDRQITHLICVGLRHVLYYFLKGRKTTGRRPKTPPKKSHSKCFRWTRIR